MIILKHPMVFEKTYKVVPGHIDIQGMMDGLYYTFYMEYCRHDFIREVMGMDLEQEAKRGISLVLSEFKISFLRSLKKDDQFTVTCELYANAAGEPKLHFKQTIRCRNKLMTKAIFTGTCIPASGGRPYLPLEIAGMVAVAPVLEELY